MTLRPATPADFGFIRKLAQNTPEFVTDEDEAALAAYLADRDARLLIWQPGAAPAGFALFCRFAQAPQIVELRRLALASPGGGAGLSYVRALTDHAFVTLTAERLWLDASGENPRACRVYQQAGYRPEGCLRGHWWRPTLGRSVDLMYFGMMRDEWLALQGHT